MNEKNELYTISPMIDVTILGVLNSLAVGNGITITAEDDIIDMGRMFYDYVKTNNETIGMTWDLFTTTFKESVKVKGEKVYICGNIINVIKGFFDNTFSEVGDKVVSSSFDYLKGMSLNTLTSDYVIDLSPTTVLTIKKPYISNGLASYNVSLRFLSYSASGLLCNNVSDSDSVALTVTGYVLGSDKGKYTFDVYQKLKSLGGDVSVLVGHTFPYSGGYEWDNSKEDTDGNYPVYVPGNLGDLVGGNGDNVWNGGWNGGNVNTSNPGVTVPNVNNPSIDVGGETTFPTDTTVPNTFIFIGSTSIVDIYIGNKKVINFHTMI